MITIINKEDIPGPRKSKYSEIYLEILEALPFLDEQQVIEYPCATPVEAANMAVVMYNWFSRHFVPKYVKIKRRGATIYIGQGANYHPDSLQK